MFNNNETRVFELMSEHGITEAYKAMSKFWSASAKVDRT